MKPTRFMVLDEKSPYPVKRRVKSRRNNGGNEPAITLLPPDPYLFLDRPDFSRPSSPRVYRTVPPKSAKNREASSFVILGDTIYSPVQSRPSSPSGRISPFRGHGFKSPTTSRPNSRPSSPKSSPKKSATNLIRGGNCRENERFYSARDVGLPPKSPKTSTSGATLLLSSKKTQPPLESIEEACKHEITATEGKENIADIRETQNGCEYRENEVEAFTAVINKSSMKREECGKIGATNEQGSTATPTDAQTVNNVMSKPTEIKKVSNDGREEIICESPPPVEKLLPFEFYKDHIRNPTPVSSSSKNKMKNCKSEANILQGDRLINKAAKPPIPPKRIGLKATLKTKEGDESKIKNTKPIALAKSNLKEKEKTTIKNNKKMERTGMKKTQHDKCKETEHQQNTDSKPGQTAGRISLGDSILDGSKRQAEAGISGKGPENGKHNEKTDRVVPCFQPDKCHIAPPTMASPSPIITSSISTPSTSAEFALSTVKSSQSISPAPTTVTSCSMSSVSSTVVLTGNLARKETAKLEEKNFVSGAKDIPKKSDSGSLKINESVVGSDKKTSSDMVKAGTKDFKKEKLFEEITSAKKIIKAEPDMEVLSPNNLRNSPPRMPPPNMAWGEERLPNGDVPARVPREGKFRRFISAVWKFLSYLLCCRCLSRLLCCKKKNKNRKPSGPSKCCCRDKSKGEGRTCCSCCPNLFKCLSCKCNKSKCCEGSLCRRNKSKSKPKDEPNQKCCAKPSCSCTSCCCGIRDCCSVFRERINNFCRCLFCLNLTCCQNLLKKCKCCHKLKCCQENGCCSCCNPYAKVEQKKLMKKSSRASNHSRGKNQLDQVLVEHTSVMKAAIPVLPTCLAVFCLICNVFIPGLGTIISGILCVCFGKPRFSTNDSPINRFKSFIVNIIIGIAQAFTVVFCLVGWGWSVWWGVIMYKLSRKQKRLKLAEKSQKEAVNANVNQNHVDVEQG